MRALVIDSEVSASIARLRVFAEANPLSLYQLKKIMEGVSVHPGDDERFVCLVPVGFRCVFTIEEHRNGKVFRHLSVSVDGDQWPNPQAVEEIMKSFGFSSCSVHDCVTYLEEHSRAINVLEQVQASVGMTPMQEGIMLFEVTIDQPRAGCDSRTVRVNGRPIGFTPLGSEAIHLQRCPNCRRENHCLSVTFGTCAWCGWDVRELASARKSGG